MVRGSWIKPGAVVIDVGINPVEVSWVFFGFFTMFTCLHGGGGGVGGVGCVCVLVLESCFAV